METKFGGSNLYKKNGPVLSEKHQTYVRLLKPNSKSKKNWNYRFQNFTVFVIYMDRLDLWIGRTSYHLSVQDFMTFNAKVKQFKSFKQNV